MSIAVIILRLVIATVLGGLVGMDRENKKRAAGLRTHILVSVGAALVMVTSEQIFLQYHGLTNLDPARLGAQVISGIGFLGAGTIIKQGFSVKGLTTAASLWAVACIGLAAGIGFYSAAVATALIVFVTLGLLSKFEKAVVDKAGIHMDLHVKMDNKPGKLGEVATVIGKAGASITNIEFKGEEDGSILVTFSLHLQKGQNGDVLLTEINALDGTCIVE